jgi:hypothetical protein
MKQRATYSKDYKKAQELKQIHETCRCEQVRCKIILKELILQAQAYATHMDEVSRLQNLLKQFEEQIK